MIFIIIGWIATMAYLSAHFYLAIDPNYRFHLYYSLNLAGAVGFVISSTAITSWQSVIINIFWAFITASTLLGKTDFIRFNASRFWLTGPAFLAALSGLMVMVVNFSMGSNVLGWAGTAFYIFGYYLFATQSIKSWQFLVYNSIASLILLPVYGLDENWPAFTLSVAWALISVIGLWRVRSTISRR